MRWAAAALFVAVMALAIYAVPDGLAQRHEDLWIAGLLAVYFATGALVGRWWAVLLAFLPVVLVAPLGVEGDADGMPTWWWALVDTVGIFLWAMLAGLVTGRLVRTWRRRHPPTRQPASG